jgi:hypothetical protein
MKLTINDNHGYPYRVAVFLFGQNAKRLPTLWDTSRIASAVITQKWAGSHRSVLALSALVVKHVRSF